MNFHYTREPQCEYALIWSFIEAAACNFEHKRFFEGYGHSRQREIHFSICKVKMFQGLVGLWPHSSELAMLIDQLDVLFPQIVNAINDEKRRSCTVIDHFFLIGKASDEEMCPRKVWDPQLCCDLPVIRCTYDYQVCGVT